MSSYFCLIKLSARFITDVFRGNRFFFSLSKIGFCNTSTVTGQQHKEIIINRYEHYLYFEKKSLKKLTFFLGWHLKNGSDFFFKLPRIFFSSYTSTEASNHDDTNSISISRNNHHQISKHSNCAGYSHDRYFQFNILNFRKNSRK